MRSTSSPDDLSKLQARFEGNRFVFQETLGSGGMGTVFKAWDPVMGREVAIKVIDPSQVSRKTVERFRTEAKLLTKISHENLILVHSIGQTTDGAPFIVMEFAHGDSLQNIIDERGVLSEELTTEIVRQICLGLQAVHDIGAVHRDLKPANIQVSFDGPMPRVKILDFGIAKIISNKPQAITTTTTLIGSPAYMSPEHLSGGKIDERCDIYSLGCIIYCCLTGAPPFDGTTSMDLAYKHIHVEPDPLSGCSEKLQQIVLSCLRKNPNDRFQRVAELLGALNSDTYMAAKIKPATNRKHVFKFALPVAVAVMFVVVLILAAYFLRIASLESTMAASFKTLRSSPDDVHAPLLVAEIKRDWDNFEELRRLVGTERACIRFGDDMSWGCSVVGEAYSLYGERNHQLGERWWRRCLELREATTSMNEFDRGKAYLGLGTELWELKRIDEAKSLFRKGLESNYPKSHFPQMFALSNLSELYLREGKMDAESKELWKRYYALLREGPTYPDSKHRMVTCLQPLSYAMFVEGDTDESRRYLKQLFQLLDEVVKAPNTRDYDAIMGATNDIALICASNAVKTAEQGKTVKAEADLADLKKRIPKFPLTPAYRRNIRDEIGRAERQIAANRSGKNALSNAGSISADGGHHK